MAVEGWIQIEILEVASIMIGRYGTITVAADSKKADVNSI